MVTEEERKGMRWRKQRAKSSTSQSGQSVGVNPETNLHPPHSTQSRPARTYGRQERDCSSIPHLSESVPTSSISVPTELPPEA